MRIGGKVIGVAVILITLLLAASSVYYTQSLRQQRVTAIGTLPSEQIRCADDSLCPQAQRTVVPDFAGIGMVIIGLLLGAYLIMNDTTQRRILDELGTKREHLGKEEQLALIMSVLTEDERKIISAVREQPGISQATLRLRTNMSKAKLSMLLKELEGRGLVARIEDGKTNAVHLKREL